MPTETPLQKLAAILEECCLEIAELSAEAEESRARTVERAISLRRRVGTVSKMAGLGELPEYRVEREVRRVAS